MAEYHFVENYERHVADLLAKYPLDEAMSLAVGGNYESIGKITADVLVYAGIRDGDAVFDFGCGSGRVAHAVAKSVNVSRYLGTDIVQSMLDYAKTKTPEHFEYKLHRQLSFPCGDNEFDMVYAFSVFTHLLQTECYTYLLEVCRALKPGGTAVISFLELAEPTQWPVFEGSLGAYYLNTFIERNQWEVWAAHAKLSISEFIDGPKAPWGGAPLGQSIMIMQKP